MREQTVSAPRISRRAKKVKEPAIWKFKTINPEINCYRRPVTIEYEAGHKLKRYDPVFIFTLTGGAAVKVFYEKTKEGIVFFDTVNGGLVTVPRSDFWGTGKFITLHKITKVH